MAGACAGAIAAWAAWMLFTQRMRSSTLRGWGLELKILGFGFWVLGLIYLRATRSRVRSGQTREKDTYKVSQYCIAGSCSAYDCKAVAGQHLEHVRLLSQPDVCTAPCNYTRNNRPHYSTAGRWWICGTFEAEEADGVLGASLADPLEQLGKREEFEGALEAMARLLEHGRLPGCRG